MANTWNIKATDGNGNSIILTKGVTQQRVTFNTYNSAYEFCEYLSGVSRMTYEYEPVSA